MLNYQQLNNNNNNNDNDNDNDNGQYSVNVNTILDININSIDFDRSVQPIAHIIDILDINIDKVGTSSREIVVGKHVDYFAVAQLVKTKVYANTDPLLQTNTNTNTNTHINTNTNTNTRIPSLLKISHPSTPITH